MLPSSDQIGVAAYHRWQRRGHQHGRHLEDWAVAEQEFTFSLNYQVVARYRLDGAGPQTLGDPDDPRCRFCERTSPRATFSEARAALPSVLGNQSVHSVEECDDCHAQFDESAGGDLERFVRAIRLGGYEPPQAYVPVAAFKGLARSALLLMPEDEMQFFEDVVEWVGNPDHGLDSRSIAGMECILHRLPEASPFSWAALASRTDDDAPFPYMLAFFGTGHAVFQIPLPLCVRDEDLEGTWTIPRVASPFGVGRGPIDSHMAIIPLSSPIPRRETRLEFVGL